MKYLYLISRLERKTGNNHAPPADGYSREDIVCIYFTFTFPVLQFTHPELIRSKVNRANSP